MHVSKFTLLRNITRASWYLVRMAATSQTTVDLFWWSNYIVHQLEKKRPPPTAGRNPGALKHQRTGINPSWASNFPWLVISEDDSIEAR